MVACNPNPSAAPKVYVITMGISYRGVVGANDSSLLLSGTFEDATEFGVAYAKLLDERKIDYEIHYMLQEYTSASRPNTWDENDATHQSKNFPTGENFEAKISEIAAKANPDDLFVFYFSGHGTTFSETERTMDDAGLVLLSTEAEATDHYVFYTFSRLLSQLEKFGCRKAIILDSCYSGNAVSEEDEADYWSKILGEHKLTESTAILTASSWNELSWSRSMKDFNYYNEVHGLMTGYLLIHAFGWEHSAREVTLLECSASLDDGGSVSIENCVEGTFGSIRVAGYSSGKYTVGENVTLAGIYDSIYSIVAETANRSGGKDYYEHMTISGGPVTAALAY